MKQKQKNDETIILTPGTQKHNRMVLLPELAKIAETSGIVITEAQSIGFKFAPFMQKVNEVSIQIAAIEQTNPTAEDAVLARKLRLSLVENRGIKGLATIHKDLKAESLVRGRLIDSFRNVVDQSSQMSELIAERIEKHSERVEAERMASLSVARIELLLPYGTDTTYLPLGKLTDEQFDKILANEKLLFEAKKAELERIEAQRLENERKAEELRLEAERLQAERIEAERIENERVRKELAEKEALLQKERETAAKEQQRRDAELAKEREAARISTEKIAAENAKKLAEQQRLAEIERKKQAEILAKQQEIARKAQAELQAKRDKEAKELSDKKAAELAALAAPDKIKIRVLYETIKSIQIPDLQSEPGKDIAALTTKRIKELLVEIANESKKLL